MWLKVFKYVFWLVLKFPSDKDDDHLLLLSQGSSQANFDSNHTIFLSGGFAWRSVVAPLDSLPGFVTSPFQVFTGDLESWTHFVGSNSGVVEEFLLIRSGTVSELVNVGLQGLSGVIESVLSGICGFIDTALNGISGFVEIISDGVNNMSHYVFWL